MQKVQADLFPWVCCIPIFSNIPCWAKISHSQPTVLRSYHHPLISPNFIRYVPSIQGELYRKVPSPGEGIPMHVEKHTIDDSVPTEDEVEAAVKKLRRNRAEGPSGIRAENIKGWLAAARRGGKATEKGKEKTAAEEEGEEMWAKVV